MVDPGESELLEGGERALGAAARLAEDEVGLALVELGEFGFEGSGDKVDVPGLRDALGLELEGGADVENDGFLLRGLVGKEFGGSRGIKVGGLLLIRRLGTGTGEQRGGGDESEKLDHNGGAERSRSRQEFANYSRNRAMS